MIPRATLRLQFHPGFTLDDAAAQVEHFAALGVSHLYASPLWTARPGSTHGYDIVDPTRINPELGGEPALRRLVAALRARDMGLVLDIVPNHMGVGACDNAWWQDVLERGPASAYAGWFDIGWHPPDPTLQGRLLAPFLGRPYGEALDAGELGLQADAAHGRLCCSYYAHRFPLAPDTYADVLEAAGPQHEPAWADALAAMRRLRETVGGAATNPGTGQDSEDAFARAQAALARALATPAGERALAAALARFDAADPAGRERLHALLERQHYRLAHWRTAADEINWRRFFEVNDLAGLRIEREEVFEAVHALTFRLYAEGLVDGLRVDHVDGLEDPGGYCRRLRGRLEELAPRRPAALRGDRAWLVVEKILAGGEELPDDWGVDGTTGYDFMDQVGALLHDPAGAEPLAALWREQAGGAPDFEAEVRAAKHDILNENLAAELAATARAFHAVALEDRATRDMTLQALQRALREFLVQLPVYRVYFRAGGRSAEDTAVIEGTVAAARATLRSPDPAVLEQLGRWLLADAATASPLLRRATVRFEHLAPPLAAKSIEDTAFYRYGRLLSRNEVGSAGSAFALGLDDFHRLAERRAGTFPHAMLAVSTHDHKRGADLRARLAVLSERPEQWAQTVARWRALNAAHRRPEPAPSEEGAEAEAAEVEVAPPEAPEPADELMLYQMLVGAWPPTLVPEDRDGLGRWAERIAAWQQKALREAQRRSSWAQPDTAYEAACERFLRRVLGLDAAGAGHEAPFLHALAGFVDAIGAAGALNALAQATLHLTTPGVPDLYQGGERWDFSLVDPDNRRAVDFAALAAGRTDPRPLPALAAAWHDGGVKQALVTRLLALRARRTALFRDGGYRPLAVEGPLREHALAFAREAGDARVLVVVTLRASHRLEPGEPPRVPPARWADTRVRLPDGWPGDWAELLAGRTCTAEGGALALAQLLADLPVAVLEAGTR